MNIKTTKSLTLIGLFAALTAALSVISFPIPITPVPVTLGIVAVFAAAMLLPPKQATLSQLVYLLIGFAGAPVFSRFGAGPGVLFGPTGGYLLAYPLMALLSAHLLALFSARKKGLNPLLRILFASFSLSLSLALCYLFGTLWYSFISEVSVLYAFSLTALPFIPVDLLKILFCAVCLSPVTDRLRAAKLLNV